MLKLVLGCLLFAAPSLTAFGQGSMEGANVESSTSDTVLANDPDFEKLMGKWIVRSVVADGELTPAQIGQKEGDIISIVPRNDRAHFS